MTTQPCLSNAASRTRTATPCSSHVRNRPRMGWRWRGQRPRPALCLAAVLAVGCSGERQAASEREAPDSIELAVPDTMELVRPADSLVAPAESLVTPPPALPRNFQFVLDASGSMRARIEDAPKMDIAKGVLREWIEEIADTTLRAGLLSYGHRRRGDCTDIQQLVPVQPLDKAELLAQIEALSPLGETPIAASVEQAVEALSAQQGRATVVLISDGRETCDPDPCGAVRRLRDEREFTLHVIGFDIAREEDALQLACLAEAGGGVYETAATVEGLIEAFRLAADTGSLARDRKVQENIQIVLDRSQPMTRPFENRTRLDAAVAALDNILELQVADRDNLAYREFGGACQADNTELVVGFQRNNTASIRQSLQGVRATGEPTLVDAVLEAAYDFDDPQRFEGVERRVLIVTGSVGTCYRAQAEERIRQTLENRQIRPDFTFIGIDIPPEEQAAFYAIARATGGRALVANDTPELQNILEDFFEDAPVFNDIDVIVDTTNAITSLVGQSMRYLNASDYSTARVQLDEARPKVTSRAVTRAFRDLARRRSKDEYQRLFQIARELRGLQGDLVSVAATALEQAEAADAEGLRRTVDDYNGLIQRFNGLVDEGNVILTTLAEQ